MSHKEILQKSNNTDATRLEVIASKIETTHATAALLIAALLAEARDLFRHCRDEGGFAGWVETRLQYSRSTAYNLLAVHERFGGENLSKCLDTLPRSVLYMLARPGTPQEARDAIIARAAAGEQMPVAEIKRVVEERKQPAEKPRSRLAQRRAKHNQQEGERRAALKALQEKDFDFLEAEAKRLATRLIELDPGLARALNDFLRGGGDLDLVDALGDALGREPPADDDDLDIPPFLRRTAPCPR